MKTIDVHGHSVPALGLGTWQLEGDACRDAVLDALALGYRHLDTAEAYGNEADVGRALARTDVARDDIFLVTKVWWENLAPGDVRRSVEASLERLRTDYVDLLLVHWPNEEQSLAATLAAMTGLQDEGKTRLIGVSNFTPSLFEQAIDEAPVVCNQVEFHPWLAQPDLLRLVQERRLMLTAYSPLARGEVLDEAVLRDIAAEHGKTPAQVVLRWLLQHQRVAAIPRASSPSHRRDNIDIFDFSLSDEEMQRIFDLSSREERLVDPDFAPAWER